jgi:hypothetical protein
MGFDQILTARVRKILQDEVGFLEKEMFGGVGFLLHGHMSCGVNQSNLIVRVGPDAYEACLLEDNIKEFDMTGRPMRGWVVAESSAVTTEADLEFWVAKGVAFARTLPSKV